MSRAKDTVIACYKLDGNLVRTYSTAVLASKSKHVYKRTIDKATRGDVLTVKNLQWRRVNKNNVPLKIEPLELKKISHNPKTIAKVDDEGKILETYPSLVKAAKENNIDPHTLRDRLNGKYSSANKTKFIYIEKDS